MSYQFQAYILATFDSHHSAADLRLRPKLHAVIDVRSQNVAQGRAPSHQHLELRLFIVMEPDSRLCTHTPVQSCASDI